MPFAAHVALICSQTALLAPPDSSEDVREGLLALACFFRGEHGSSQSTGIDATQFSVDPDAASPDFLDDTSDDRNWKSELVPDICQLMLLH
jgi:hypothetical protein